MLADLRRALAEETGELVRRAGAEALTRQTDVADPESLRALFEEVERRFGALHILHNNAGLGEGDRDWPDVSVERAAKVVDTNLRGVVAGTRLVLAPMRRAGGGVVVNTSSGAAFVALPPQAVYAATKAGVVSFTRSCAPLAESHGVSVCCICPGLVATQMVEESGRDGPAAWLRQVIDSVEVLTPEQVAAAVVDLIGAPDNAGKVVQLENPPRRPDS